MRLGNTGTVVGWYGMAEGRARRDNGGMGCAPLLASRVNLSAAAVVVELERPSAISFHAR